ncbi:MAG: carbamoyltransferase N-terminal domain-containing protein, partial [Chitinophagaceae bacterium]
MNLLGINSFFEHPSAALLTGNKLSGAVEEERLTGIKGGKKYSAYVPFIPLNSIINVLEIGNITSDDIDAIAYSYSPSAHFWSPFKSLLGKRFSSFKEELAAKHTVNKIPDTLYTSIVPSKYQHILNTASLKQKPFFFFNHHLCHAVSSYCCSGFGDALVMVIDGSGENYCTSVYTVISGKIKRIGGQDLPSSLGLLYSLVTSHLGFDSFQDEFKVMGLAAYGEPVYLKEFSAIVSLSENGNYQVSKNALKNLDRLFGKKRTPDEEITDKHRNIASSLQRCYENTVMHILSYYKKKTGLSNLCVAGGSFLNCVCNGKIAAAGLFDDIFVLPASDDSGTAIGAAALVNYKSKGYLEQLEYQDFFLGRQYHSNIIHKILQDAKVPYEEYSNDGLLAKKIAAQLTEGKIGGLFRGRMEFGPRALGNRTMLSTADKPEYLGMINKIKGREGFRPVAPIVKAEKAAEYFNGKTSEYMTFTAAATEKAKTVIPAAIHADGTARVQLVTKESNPFLYLVLDEY